MRKITFIGGEGSGKTVLLAVLAHRYRERRPDQAWFYPLGRTLTQVGSVISALESGDWPPSTLQGMAEEWRWRIEFPSGLQAETVAHDCAGQDLRRIFNGHTVPKELELLHANLTTSDIVFFLLNLNDFIGLPESSRLGNELLLKEAMDKLTAVHRRCVLVLTQVDRYDYLLAKHGSWQTVVGAVAPHLHAGHIASGGIPVFGVAAVAQTETRFLPKENRAMVLPKPRFTSRGLNELMAWLPDAMRTLAKRDEESRQKNLRAEKNAKLWRVAKVVAVAGIGAFLISFISYETDLPKGTGVAGVDHTMVGKDTVWFQNNGRESIQNLRLEIRYSDTDTAPPQVVFNKTLNSPLKSGERKSWGEAYNFHGREGTATWCAYGTATAPFIPWFLFLILAQTFVFFLMRRLKKK